MDFRSGFVIYICVILDKLFNYFKILILLFVKLVIIMRNLWLLLWFNEVI